MKIRRVFKMLNHAECAWIDNYLDLYLYAGRLHDKEWQVEIKARLAELRQDETESDGQRGKSLKQQFIEVNRQILALYHLLGRNAVEETDEFTRTLFTLKKKRLDLGREIDALKRQNLQISVEFVNTAHFFTESIYRTFLSVQFKRRRGHKLSRLSFFPETAYLL